MTHKLWLGYCVITQYDDVFVTLAISSLQRISELADFLDYVQDIFGRSIFIYFVTAALEKDCTMHELQNGTLELKTEFNIQIQL